MIDNIDKFREYIPTIISDGDFSKYRQSVNDAQTWVVNTLLGSPLFDQIHGLAKTDKLYVITEKLIAYTAYRIAIPKIDLVESKSGFAVVNDAKLLPASRERVAALVASMQRSAEQVTAELLDYLEDSPNKCSEWKSSPAYTIMADSLLPTLREFRHYGTFSGGALEFMAARPAIQSIIRRHIEPRISCELTREIISQVQDDTLTDDNKTIISDLKFALAAYYSADPEFAEISIARVRHTIESTPDKFPAFKGSELYCSIDPDVAPKNSTTTSIYIM